MTPRTRQGLVWGGLVATLAAVAGVDTLPAEDSLAPLPATRSAARPTPAPPSAPTPRTPWPDAPAAALAAWGQPRPAPALPPAPPEPEPAATTSAPAPPPLPPYRWIGRIEEDGRQRALLAGATRTVLVGDGELIDGQWRIDRVGERGLELTWLPGQVAQRLGPAS
jgi:hypothetical protein